MSIAYFDHVYSELVKHPSMQHTVNNMGLQTFITVAGTVAGAVIGGKNGALLGTALGSIVGYSMVDDYKSLLETLGNLPDDEKDRLGRKMKQLVHSYSLVEFLGNETLRKGLLDMLSSETKSMIQG